MWRRLLAASTAVLLGLVAAALLYAQSETGGRHLCAIAGDLVRDATGEPIEVGRCLIEPFAPGLRLEEVSVAAGPLKLRTERVEVRLRWGALLSGRIGIDRVHVVAPRVALDLTRAGDGEEPSEPLAAGDRPCLDLPARLEIGRVTVVRGALDLSLPDGAGVRAENLSVSLAGLDRSLGAQVSAGRIDVRHHQRAITISPLETSATLGLDTQALTLHRLEAEAPELKLSATGVLDDLCAMRGSVELAAALDLERAGVLIADFVQELGGRARIEAKLTSGDEGLRGSGSVVLEEGRVLGLGPFDATSKVALEGLELRATDLHVRLDTGNLQLNGTLGLTPPFRTEAEFDFHNLVLGELLTRLTVPDLPVHLSLTGTGRLAGVLTGPEGLLLSGHLEGWMREFGVFDRSWRRRKGAERYAGFDVATVRTELDLRLDRVDLRNTRIRTGRTEVHTRGPVHFDTALGLGLEVEASALQLADLGPFGIVDAEGRGTLVGSVKGPYSNLDIRAKARLGDVTLMGLELRQLMVDARIHDDALEVFGVEGLKIESVFTGGGRIAYGGDDIVVAGRLDLQKARGRDLLQVARRFAPEAIDSLGPVTASVTGSISVAGRLRAPDAFLNLELADAEIFGQAMDVGRLVASLEEGDRLEIDRAWLRSGGAALEGSGRASLRGGDFAGKLSTRGLRLEEVAPLAAMMPDLSGAATLDLNARGTFESPRVEGLLDLTDWYLGEQPLASARLALRLAGRRVRVQGSVLSPWPKGEEPPPRAPGEPLPVPPRSMQHAVRADLALEPGLPFGLELNLSVADVQVLAPPDVLDGIDGSLSGRLSAQGELADWRSIDARLELPRLWVRRDRYRIDCAAPAVVTMARGRIALEALPLRGPGFELDAEGLLEPDGQVTFNLQGGADLTMLPRLLPELEDGRGRAELKVAVSGTLANPTVVGHATLERAGVRLRGLPMALSDGHGSLTFSPEAVLIDGLEARLNGGAVEASGHLSLDRLRPRALDLRVRLDEIPLRLDGTPLLISGMPELRGPIDGLTLGGELELVRLHFRQDLDLERTALRAWELSRRPPAPQVLERASELLNLDLGIRLGDVRVDNNLLNAEFRGDLRVTGTHQRPGLLGTVTVSDGRARLRSTEFDIDSGVVSFTDRNRIRPSFDLRAETRVREFQVSVIASGTPQQPRLLLSSEPPLSEADILMLLTLGVTSFDLDRTDGASLGGFLLDAAYNASGIGDQVRRLMPQGALLRDAAFRMTSAYSEISGQIEPIAQFETRFLVEGLKLRAQTSLMGGRGKRAQAEYRLDDGISAQAQWDSENPSAPSSGDIGADLKIHWESR